MTSGYYDQVLFRFEADLATLNVAMKQIQGQLQKVGTDSQAAAAQATRSFTGMEQAANRLRTVFAALAGALTFRALYQTNAQFQMLQARLETAVGDVDKAKQAFQALEDFGTRTPFTLDQVVTAFTTLQSRGIDPTLERLESFGNVASSQGRSLIDFIEAVSDASVNEFERLKGFGIKTQQMGDQVAFTFRGSTTVVKKSAEDIAAYLDNLGRTVFAGSMERQMNTLTGAMSNVEDAMASLARTIGSSGLNEQMVRILRSFAGLLEQLQPLAVQVGTVLAFAFRQLAEALDLVRENLDIIMPAIGALVGANVGARVGAIGGAAGSRYGAIAGAIAGAVGGSLLEVNPPSEGGPQQRPLPDVGFGGQSNSTNARIGRQATEANQLRGQLEGVVKQLTAMSQPLPQIAELSLRFSELSEQAQRAGLNVEDITEAFDLADQMARTTMPQQVIQGLQEQNRLLSIRLELGAAEAELERTLNELKESGAFISDAQRQTIRDLIISNTQMQETLQSQESAWKDLEKTIEGWGRRSAKAIADWATGAQSSFRDVARTFVSEILEKVIYQSVTGPAASFLSGALGMAGTWLGTQFGSAAPTTGGAFYGTEATLGPGSALGNAFEAGRVRQFAMGGVVVTNPGAFPMAGGMVGTIAEHGPEGILPLDRDMRTGKLGVRATGVGGQGVSIQQTNVFHGVDPAFTTQLERAMAMTKEATIAEIMDQRVRDNGTRRVFLDG